MLLNTDSYTRYSVLNRQKQSDAIRDEDVGSNSKFGRSLLVVELKFVISSFPSLFARRFLVRKEALGVCRSLFARQLAEALASRLRATEKSLRTRICRRYLELDQLYGGCASCSLKEDRLV